MSKNKTNRIEILDNPLMPLMTNGLGSMPGLPSIIQNALPVPIPQMRYEQNIWEMVLGNTKRKRMEKAMDLEAKMAEHSRRAVEAKLNTMHSVLTFSARIADTLAEHEHTKTMRSLEIQEKNIDIYTKRAKAQQLSYDAKLSELDYTQRMEQYKKQHKDE